MTVQQPPYIMWKWLRDLQPDLQALGFVPVTNTRMNRQHWATPRPELNALCDAELQIFDQETLNTQVIPAPTILQLRPCRACTRSFKIYERWQQLQEGPR